MRPFFVLTLLAYFLGTGSAFTTGYYLVTRLDTRYSNGLPSNSPSVTFSFDVTDPDPVTNTSTTCTASWNPRRGNYPKSAVRLWFRIYTVFFNSTSRL